MPTTCSFHPLLSRILLIAILAAGIAATTSCASWKIRELRTENHKLHQRAIMAEQDKEAVEDELAEVTALLAQSEKRVAELQQRVDMLEAELTQAQRKLQATQLSLTQSADSQSGAFAEQLKESLQRETEMKLHIEQIQAKIGSLETEKMQEEEKRLTIENELEKLREDAALIVQQKNTFEQNLLQLREESTERQEAMEQLSEEKQELEKIFEASQKQLAEANERNTAMQEELQEQERVIASLGEQKTALEEKVEQVQAAKSDRAKASSALLSAAQEALRPHIADNSVRVEEAVGALKLVLFGDDLFQSGTTLISDEGMAMLSAVEKIIRDGEFSKIEVIGHTDSTPILNMPYPDNWELAAARASAVVRSLTSRPGIPSEPFVAESRSFQEPIGDNQTPAGRRLNRRVEIVLHPE